ncbi:hypothetical protein GTR04_6299 [Trichophyton interdigitale]|uniref:Uncharacterized protein n=1 Tax=Trichophyton interdigitale TaxID=101480 RepID=A0A9P4YDH5_9EURO|nr:hypothetical protein GY632_4834 [Trichophyton interdigitale]KAF3893253.1 hypothetical protein GY631_3789 [Trichophyton interdigitale]KAG8206318.1 hypothetical protein GTR04_6299 [Trichophyton interdigitale]
MLLPAAAAAAAACALLHQPETRRTETKTKTRSLDALLDSTLRWRRCSALLPAWCLAAPLALARTMAGRPT